MVIFPFAPDQTIAQMWSNGARGGVFWYKSSKNHLRLIRGSMILDDILTRFLGGRLIRESDLYASIYSNSLITLTVISAVLTLLIAKVYKYTAYIMSHSYPSTNNNNNNNNNNTVISTALFTDRPGALTTSDICSTK